MNPVFLPVRSIQLERGEMSTMRHSASYLLPAPPPTGAPDETTTRTALIILNQCLPCFTPLLWDRALLRLCADGGANRLYDDMPLLFPTQTPLHVRNRYKPDLIKGDMDSIRPEVLSFYSNLGTKIVDESYDQDSTDLRKCVTYICNCTPDLEKSNLHILVTGALGGRFDHEAGNVNVVYRFSNMRIILLSDDCLIHLLPKTCRHEIHIQQSVEGPHCGLIPMGAPSACTTTTGLQWNLSGTEMKFGGVVSTSNIVREDVVTVYSDSDLLWTISIRKPN